MSKRISAKIGTYMKDGQEKGKYVDLGAILSNQNGEFILLNPSVSLSGVLAMQNTMAMTEGKQLKDNVMCSIFDNSQGNYNNNSQPPAQQSVPNMGQQQQQGVPYTSHPSQPMQQQVPQYQNPPPQNGNMGQATF